MAFLPRMNNDLAPPPLVGPDFALLQRQTSELLVLFEKIEKMVPGGLGFPVGRQVIAHVITT